MNVLVLGGNGFVGKEVINQLKEIDSITPFIGSRLPVHEPNNSSVSLRKIDSTNFQELREGLKGIDVVINCVTGDGRTISVGAKQLCKAAAESGYPKIIHLSSQSVYGTKTGCLSEKAAVQDDLGWYGHAKIMAERSMQEYAELGGSVVILRPGCICGKNSPLWTVRIVDWLQGRKLGDLGAFGDGWSNLIDVTDVAQAAIKSISVKKLSKEVSVYNLSAPDSPRWNQYFIDLSVSVGAIPVKRVSQRSLKINVYFFGIPIKVAERVLKKIHINASWLPQVVPPSLLKLFKQSIKLNSQKAIDELDINWTNYSLMVKKASSK